MRTGDAGARTSYGERMPTEPTEQGQAGDPSALPTDGPGHVRLTAFVRGEVQGVGFRWWVRAQALELGLTGFAANLPDGRVQVLAEGEREGCAQLLARLGEQPSTTGRPGSVAGVSGQWLPARGVHHGFVER